MVGPMSQYLLGSGRLHGSMGYMKIALRFPFCVYTLKLHMEPEEVNATSSLGMRACILLHA